MYIFYKNYLEKELNKLKFSKYSKQQNVLLFMKIEYSNFERYTYIKLFDLKSLKNQVLNIIKP